MARPSSLVCRVRYAATCLLQLSVLTPGCEPVPDFTIGNLDFHVLTDEVAWIHTDDAQARLARMVEAGATALDRSPGDIPAGSAVLVVSEHADVCGGHAACWNVEDGDWRHPEGKRWVILLRTNGGIGPPVTCPERLGLMHELAHGFLPPGPGNWDHEDAATWSAVDGTWLRLLYEAIAAGRGC